MTESVVVKIPLNHETSLRKFGYSTKNTAAKRMKSLLKAIQEIDNYAKIQKRLTVLRTYYKKTHTDKHNVFNEDIQMLKKWRQKNPDLYKSKKTKKNADENKKEESNAKKNKTKNVEKKNNKENKENNKNNKENKDNKENKEKNQKGKNALYSKKEILEASKRIKEMIQE
jgi:hypothetical protein